ncbi:MAG: response regulator [Anaerolineae bacterium]|nr:response regulator [Anaerolineae bacterium]
MNITTRLFIWFLVIAMSPFLAAMVIVSNIAERNTRADVFDTLTIAANNQALRLETYVQTQLDTLLLLSRQTFLSSSTSALQSGDLTTTTRAFRESQVREYWRQFETSLDFDDMMLVDVEGDVVFSLSLLPYASVDDPALPTPTLREAVHQAIAAQAPVLSAFAPVDGETIAFAAAPLYLANRMVGILAVRLTSASLYEIVTDRIGLGETGETNVGILEGDQVVFTAPTRFNPTAAFSTRIRLGESLGQAIQQGAQGNGGQGEILDYRGVSVVAVWRYLPTLRWGLVVKQDAEEAFITLTETRRALVPILLATIVLVGLMAVIVANSFTKPIHLLTDAVRRMSGGDLISRVGEIRAGGEFAVLARGFDRMAGQLHDLIERLEERIAERTRQIEQYAHEMANARAEADRANAAKTIFLTNMSHELRTPMNAILGFAQMLETDRAVPAKQREYIGIIARSGEHLLSLINELLDMARIESGQISIVETAFELRYTLRGIEEMMTLRAGGKGLQLEVEIADAVPPYIRADEGKLRQVIINLIGNAIKFTDEGGISVRCGLVGAALRFEIEDTGAGIAPEELNKLFQPFSQTETGTKAQEGTGLGLAISRAYVLAMGGEMQVRSVVGQGTIFTFSLPLAVASAEEARTGSENTHRPVGILPPDDVREWRILVVDDKPENRQLIRVWMEEVGFSVREAADGHEAVMVWDVWEPHLIWMDMRMPVMDGYEATRRIKSAVKGSATAVIALTASTLDNERQLVLSAGCDDFVRKPARVSTLFQKLEEHLGIRFAYQSAADDDDGGMDQEDAGAALTREALAALPDSWRGRLREAVQRLDLTAALRAVEEIAADHPDYAAALRDLINSFRFDTLQELI